MKRLYVLTRDNGDGSRSVGFTFNEDFIDEMEERYESNQLDIYDWGFDGDGFSYTRLFVNDDQTIESLGISYDIGNDD